MVNDKNKIILIISVCLMVIWMIVVFNLSSEASELSSERSGGLLRNVITIFNRNITESNLKELIELLQPISRKTAHFLIYTLGGVFIYNFMYNYFINYKKESNLNYSMIFSIIIGFFYAATDEFHQLFVDGRSGEFRDICIDTIGIIFGVFLLYLIFKISKRIKSKIVL